MNWVEGHKTAWRWWSVQAMTLANAFLLTWAALPAKFQDALPVGAMVGITVGLLTLGTLGRLVNQNVPDKPVE